jgi:hypothetical protein
VETSQANSNKHKCRWATLNNGDFTSNLCVRSSPPPPESRPAEQAKARPSPTLRPSCWPAHHQVSSGREYFRGQEDLSLICCIISPISQ